MRILNARDYIKIIREHGFVFDRQAKGSHEIWHNPDTGRRTVVPNHGPKDIPQKTLRKMVRQSGLDAGLFS